MCCSQGGTFIYHIHSHIFKVVIFYCASCFEPKIWCFLNADLPPKATSLHMRKLRATTSHYVYFHGYLSSLLQMCVVFALSVPIIIPRAWFCYAFLYWMFYHIILFSICMKICKVGIIKQNILIHLPDQWYLYQQRSDLESAPVESYRRTCWTN